MSSDIRPDSTGNRSGEYDPQKAAFLHNRNPKDWSKRGYEPALIVSGARGFNPERFCQNCNLLLVWCECVDVSEDVAVEEEQLP